MKLTKKERKRFIKYCEQEFDAGLKIALNHNPELLVRRGKFAELSNAHYIVRSGLLAGEEILK